MSWNATRPGLRATAAVLAVLSACSQAPDQRVRAGGDTAARLLASGGRLVQDYGAFQVIEAPAALAAAADDAVPLDGRILLNAGAFDPATPGIRALRAAVLPARGRTLALVQLAGPIRPEWYQALLATGVRIVAYVPNDAYLVYGDAPALEALSGVARAGAFVRWSGAYLGADKLAPAAASATTSGAWSVQLVEDPAANAGTLAAIAAIEEEPSRSAAALGYVNVVARLPASALPVLAARPDVVSIQPWVEPAVRDERQAMIVAGQVAGSGPAGPGYLAWLAAKGFTQAQFTASGFGVDVTDSGVDNGTLAPNHFGLYVGGDVLGASRLAYARLEGTGHGGSTIEGCDGHGTINAHIIGGYVATDTAPHVDGAGYHYGLGIAPFVRVGSSVIFDPSTFTNPRYEDLLARAYRDGMRISSNSWGANTNLYTSDSQRYDALVRDAQPAASAVPSAGNQEMVIVFAAGNAGSSARSLGSPGTAKNVITVGGTEGVQPFGAADRCGIGDPFADAFDDIATFSSRGPTSDERRKPDLVAPATHVSGGVAQAPGQRTQPPASPLGQASSCFVASGVCAGPGTSAYFPVGQQWYTASSGTSHSTPAVAGAAALLRQWFVNQGRAPPSPAMTKAYLTNSARYLRGSGANDTLPSNSQGLGMVDLGVAFDGVGRFLLDQEPANLLTASGQTRAFTGAVSDPTRPFRVTLAWTDAPGSTAGAAYANDLDLTVSVGGHTYRGNVFSGAASVTGGAADAMNNVESVFLPAGVTGPFTVTVTAANIVADGVPGNGSGLDQDFALVFYNVCTTAPPALLDLTVSVPGRNQVLLAWGDGAAAEYRVYRGVTAGGPYTLLGSTTSPTYLDTTVSGGATYHYVVRGVACAESPDSNEVSVVATGDCTLAPTFTGATAATSNGTATCGNTVTWDAATPSCGGTLSYEVFRSTSPGFAPGLANRIATGITGTSFLDDLNLASGATYHYVVRATETSATTTVTEANGIERSAPVHGPLVQVFLDDLDANRPPDAAASWIPITLSGTAGTLNLTSGCRHQSATSAYRFGAASTSCGGAYPNGVDALLSLGGGGIAVPAGTGARLEFSHWYDVENRWDGAWLVYSTTGPNGPWTAVDDAVSATAPYVSSGGYTGLLQGYPVRVWTGRNAGPNGALASVAVDLGALAGQTVWLGWRFHTDNSIVNEGYYLDDVRITSQAACTPRVPPPGTAVSLSLSAPASWIAGVPSVVTVSALDAAGAVAADYAGRATFTSSDGSAVLPASLPFTGGTATASVELRTAGPQTIAVTDPANPAMAARASTVVTAGAAARLEFVEQASPAVAGAPMTPAPAVAIRDAFGNVTSSTAPVTVALAGGAVDARLSGATTAAAQAGVASFPALAIDRAADGYRLVASSPGLPAATGASFGISPAAAERLVFSQGPADLVAGRAFPRAIRVEAHDRFGNLATGFEGGVTLALARNPGSARLVGRSTATAVSGTATFPDVSIQRAGVGYAMSAAASGLPEVVTEAFAVVPAAAARLALTGLPASIDADATATVAVVAYDAWDNVAAGYAGTIRLGASDRAARLPADAQAVAGVASGLRVAFHTPGTQVLTVEDVGDRALLGSATTAVAGRPGGGSGAAGGGCGCGAGSPGEAGLVLALAALWRSAVAPRRRDGRRGPARVP